MNTIVVRDFVTGKLVASFPMGITNREKLIEKGWEQVSRFKIWIWRYEGYVLYFEDLMGWFDEL